METSASQGTTAPNGRSSNMDSNGAQSSLRSRQQRVLACTLCQQRKVKCDRNFPCGNCIKSRSQCMPASVNPRQRRRRYPERALLDRLRRYEDLLRQNAITFEPLHSAAEKASPKADPHDESPDEQAETVASELSASSIADKAETASPAKSVFHFMSKPFRDPDNDSDSSHDDLREVAVKKAWDQVVDDEQYLLFGSHATSVSLYTLHPDPIQIFRLWQIYVDNINPLLKVTHIPSLQGRVIEAASNIISIDPALEALMFSIYCTAVLSLTVEECQMKLGASKEDLLSKYRSGCQQALWSCNFLRTSDRDCLTALFLYLLSARPSVAPQSLSPILGLAIRIARRMGMHSESTLAKCTPFEAEMRRRLWWPLVLFDTRMSELGNSKTLTMDPTWDCRIPLNVSDADLRPEMKVPPAPRAEPTDAIFAVVRVELSDYVRHTTMHLDFGNPALVAIAKHGRIDGSHLVALEKSLEDRYLKFCDQENPIHFMALWTVRAQFARYHVLEHNRGPASSASRRADGTSSAATASAVRYLECDTNIMTSPLSRGFVWLNQMYFPFPAYFQICQDLRKRPTDEQAEKGWAAMSDSWDAWYNIHFRRDSPIIKLLPKFVLQAWEAYEAVEVPSAHALATPRIITSIKEILAQLAEDEHNSNIEGVNAAATNLGTMPLTMPMTPNFANQIPAFGLGSTQENYAWMTQGMGSTSESSGQFPPDAYMNQMDWSSFGGQSGF